MFSVVDGLGDVLGRHPSLGVMDSATHLKHWTDQSCHEIALRNIIDMSDQFFLK